MILREIAADIMRALANFMAPPHRMQRYECEDDSLMCGQCGELCSSHECPIQPDVVS